MTVVEEMKELRNQLDTKGIKWEDNSTDSTSPTSFPNYWICRTRFEYKGENVSVINGFGTYGGFDPFGLENEGLLEVMTELINDNEPVGYLTADEVMEILENGY